MKLIIQIPCLNERDTLPATYVDLPRRVPGIDEIEVLVVDDGSSDGTDQVAAALGVHHIVQFPENRGLAAAYLAGLDAAVRLGADVIVNTDADNQYCAGDIAALVAPIVAGEADMVVGDRQTDTLAHFSPTKRLLQRVGSRVVRSLSGTTVQDTTSGFRAVSRATAFKLCVHNRFTYTLESLLHAGQLGLTIRNVPVRVNPQPRKSRLFSSIGIYVRKSALVILRSYAMVQPVRIFGLVAVILFLVGATLCGRFLWFYLLDPTQSGHVQSLLVGVGSVVLSFIVTLMAMLGDLLAANRRLAEETLARVRRLEADLEGSYHEVAGVLSTGAEPWQSEPLSRVPDLPVAS